MLALADAAYAWKDDNGKLRIHQELNTTRAGAAGGALWGTLIGLIFLNPLAGMDSRRSHRRGHRQADRRGDQRRHDQADRRTAPAGQGGGVPLGPLGHRGRVIEALKPFQPTVIQTNLSRDREDELVKARQAPGVRRQSRNHQQPDGAPVSRTGEEELVEALRS